MIIFSIINQLISDINNYGWKMRLLKINIVTRVGKLNICIYCKIESPLPTTKLSWEKKD